MAIKGQPLINGTAYSHADISLVILGVPIVEVSEIAYSDVQDITLNYGTGNQPTSRGFGNINPTGSITIAKKEFDKIREAAPDGKIQNISDFPIGVNYLTEAGDFTRDRLLNCRFVGADISSSQNNSRVEVTLELSIAAIQFGA